MCPAHQCIVPRQVGARPAGPLCPLGPGWVDEVASGGSDRQAHENVHHAHSSGQPKVIHSEPMVIQGCCYLVLLPLKACLSS